MTQVYPAKSMIAGKPEVLAIGLITPIEPGLATSLYHIPFQWKTLSTASEASRWLSGNKHGLPLMIFADYQAVKAKNFAWVSQFRRLAKHRYIPVIILNCPEGIDQDLAFTAGIDDWYSSPQQWSDLIQRGRQLQRIRSQIDQLQKPFLPISKKTAWQKLKRVMDVVAAATLLLLLSPVFLLIALAIKLESKGPVIYTSKRAGQNYRVFDFLKFRSMYVNADQQLQALQHLNQYQHGQQGTFVKFKNDPRVTRVGRIIRKTSLDELPQLINVLRGEMSMVGNRPLPLYEAVQLCQDESAERFMAPAGITGLWQVTKRGKDDMSASERIKLDIEYCRKSSFWFDLKIVFMTFPAMLQHENV